MQAVKFDAYFASLPRTVVRTLCHNRLLREHPWAKQDRLCVLFLSDAPPIWTWVGDSVSPPHPCMEPSADQKEKCDWSSHCFVVDHEAEGKQEASAGTPQEDLAIGGRKMLYLCCRSSGRVMKRIALMCMNAACQNDSFSSANLLKNNCPCATLKCI